MTRYVLLLRGINVGGKNKIPMAALRECLHEAGFPAARTLIASGNVVLDSDLEAATISAQVEELLLENFTLDVPVRVRVIDQASYLAIVASAPPGFGTEAGRYRYDVIFLLRHHAAEAMAAIALREGVDAAWPGEGVVYFRRPAVGQPDATRSLMGKIASRPIYADLTIRNWNTTLRLAALLES